MLSLCITGFDGDPDDITSILGINPTSIGRKGEPSPKRRPRTFNGWWLDTHPSRITEGAAHHSGLTAMIRLLDGRAERFARVRAQFNPTQMAIYGGLYPPPDDQCGIWLDPAQMRVLADCGVGWGVDILGEAPLNYQVA